VPRRLPSSATDARPVARCCQLAKKQSGIAKMVHRNGPRTRAKHSVLSRAVQGELHPRDRPAVQKVPVSKLRVQTPRLLCHQSASRSQCKRQSQSQMHFGSPLRPSGHAGVFLPRRPPSWPRGLRRWLGAPLQRQPFPLRRGPRHRLEVHLPNQPLLQRPGPRQRLGVRLPSQLPPQVSLSRQRLRGRLPHHHKQSQLRTLPTHL